MRLLILSMLTIFTVSAVHADTWTVFRMDPSWEPSDEYCPRDLTFTFSGGRLSLNSTATSTGGGGSSTHTWQLLFSGNWAVAGTIDETGSIIRDPYATFIYDKHGGYINWASDTPSGYTTQLLLGYRFDGDWAETYQNYEYEQPFGEPVTGTLVLWDYLVRCPLENDIYTPQNHEFSVTAVPEPSSIGILGFAVWGLGTVSIRKKQQRRREVEFR
ncbi:MAG: PEP-CTERM sorting domain-containing protein [Armatimonadota bacterium]